MSDPNRMLFLVKGVSIIMLEAKRDPSIAGRADVEVVVQLYVTFESDLIRLGEADDSVVLCFLAASFRDRTLKLGQGILGGYFVAVRGQRHFPTDRREGGVNPLFTERKHDHRNGRVGRICHCKDHFQLSSRPLGRR